MMKKVLALAAALCVLLTAFSGLSLTASAASVTLTDSYDAASKFVIGEQTGYNSFRWGGKLVRYDPGFDFKTDCSGQYNAYAAYKTRYDTYGAGYTCTNSAGVDIAVNRFGYVIEVSAKGNLKIPTDGYVLSAVNTDDGTSQLGTNVKANVQVGDYIHATAAITKDASGKETATFTYTRYRTTDDSFLTDESTAFSFPYPILSESCTRAQWDEMISASETTAEENASFPAYNNLIVVGGDGVKTGSSYWNNDVLVKITGTNTHTANNGQSVTRYVGYVVSVGGNNIDVPAGYFAVKLTGQTASDTGNANYNGATLFKEFVAPGTIVSCGLYEMFVRHDVAAAKRAAHLLTGEVKDSIGVTQNYEFSASSILYDALTKYELVDTDRMTALYENMKAICNATASMTGFNEIEPYMATLNQNYAEMCRLEYEVRTVEMRATWMRPLPNDGVKRTAEELDALLTEDILHIKSLGYNMIFIEAFYNSTTVFPIPDGVGYQDPASGLWLQFRQNPHLTAAYNENLTEDYDMLKRFVEICKANDIEPHIWWEVFYVGYQRTNGLTDALFDYSVAKTILENPDVFPYVLNTASNGEKFYGAYTDGALQYFLNPGDTVARTFLMNTFRYVWEHYDVCSFQLDYIRYPHTNAEKCFGYDEATLRAFKNSSYYDPSRHTDSYLYSYSGFYDADWVQFRANYVTSFVYDIRTQMKAVRPDMYLTSSPGAEPEESKANLMQDVSYWLQNDYIDIIFPMAYGENVPGFVSAGLVKDNAHHYVCTGVSGTYRNPGMEAMWLKQVRDAGADGLAAFGLITDYVDYVWAKPAVSPTGNAAKAARVYLTDTVAARAAQMQKLGGITASQYAAVIAAAEDASETIRLYGIDADEAGAALSALQAGADTLGDNAKAAMTKDVNYLVKIRNNSLDEEMQTVALQNSTDTLTVNGDALSEDSDAFRYVASTDTLVLLADTVTLCGTMTETVDIVVPEEMHKLTLDAVALASSADLSATTVKLKGENRVDGTVTAQTFCGTGALYSGDTLLVRMGDVVVDGADALDTADLRHMLRYLVQIEDFTDDQLAVMDANGDGKRDTRDVRLFLDAMLG